MGAGWQPLERATFVAAIDNHDPGLAQAWAKAHDEKWALTPGLQTIMEKAASVVIGIDHDGELRLNAYASCANEKDTVAVANAAIALTTSVNPPAETWLRTLETQVGFARTPGAAQLPPLAHVHAHIKVTWADLFDHLSATAKVAAEELDDKKK
jgi:hypothetical protein